MMFHEIYSCYYQAVAEILARAADGGITEKEMKAIVDEAAFSESFLAILPALKEQQWQLLVPSEDGSWSTPLKHRPDRPMSLLEKRWLAAIWLDPRIQLFVDSAAGLPEFLQGVEPLYRQDDFVVFDQYGDGDPYDDEAYQNHFRLLMEAIRGEKRVEIKYPARNGSTLLFRCQPYLMEYSEKDDKFRVLVSGTRKADALNVARILECRQVADASDISSKAREEARRKKEAGPVSDACLVLELTDERNALERVMLHFAHFQKEAERLEDSRYRLKIHYHSSDTAEMVIRVLGFGPMVRVTEPPDFVELVKDKLRKQMEI